MDWFRYGCNVGLILAGEIVVNIFRNSSIGYFQQPLDVLSFYGALGEV